jgi:diacylglycerol O-acyltransferase / wax synthase
VSVDDVLVGAVATGLGAYLRRRGYVSESATLRAMLPVSTRGAERALTLGNRVSSIFVDLPVGIRDFASAVRHVSWSKATLRTTHAADGGALAIEATRLLPAPLQAPVLRFVSGLPFAHLIVSDVPGPEQPMYLNGRRILGSFPMMPLAADIGLSIAMLTIGPQIGLGVTSDPKIVPDPQALADDIGRALAGAATHPLQARRRKAA